MSGKETKGGTAKSPAKLSPREERLAEALRANLQKRKAQARSRRAGEADLREDGIAAARDEGE
jgi:hypothetical protein